MKHKLLRWVAVLFTADRDRSLKTICGRVSGFSVNSTIWNPSYYGGCQCCLPPIAIDANVIRRLREHGSEFTADCRWCWWNLLLWNPDGSITTVPCTVCNSHNYKPHRSLINTGTIHYCKSTALSSICIKYEIGKILISSVPRYH